MKFGTISGPLLARMMWDDCYKSPSLLSEDLATIINVELLLQDLPMERVRILLGHSSIGIMERHYSPWVRARQEQLEADVGCTWNADPVLSRQTKGTPRVLEKKDLVN